MSLLLSNTNEDGVINTAKLFARTMVDYRIVLSAFLIHSGWLAFGENMSVANLRPTS